MAGKAKDDGSPLAPWHVTRVLDALDEKRSTLERFDSGHIMDITAHAFIAERVAGVSAFTLPMRASDIFVDQGFVDRVRKAGLTGVEFELCRSLEGGPVDLPW